MGDYMLRGIVTLLLSFCLLQIGAQSPNIKFKHFTSKEGLAQNNVMDILRDSEGFMWFGTRDGLNRFDGYNYRLFRNDPDDSLSLSNNYIRSLCEDDDGFIWVGTAGGGLERFCPEKEEFVSFNSVPGNKTRLPGLFVNSLIEDSKGNLWIGTGRGLAMLNKERTTFTTFSHNPDDPESISDGQIRDLMEDSNGNIWIGFWHDVGLNKYNPETGVFTSLGHDSLDVKSEACGFVRALCESRAGLIYIGTDAGGLSVYNPETNSFTNYRNDPDNPQSISHNVVTAFAEDNMGNIWMGTENGGLNIFNPERDEFTRLHEDEIDAKGINNNSIYSMYRDPDGNIWIGTYTGGVNVYFESYNLFQHYRKKDDPGSLSHNNVLCFEEDHKGRIWIGTDGGGVNVFDLDNQEFKCFRDEEGVDGSLDSDYVVNLLEDSRLNLWAGTWGGGLNLYNGQNNSFNRFSDVFDFEINSDRVWVIYEDYLGKFWIGTFYDGLYQYDFETGDFYHFLNGDDGVSADITVLIEDKHNRLWVGTDQSGLYLYDRETQTFRQFKGGVDNDCKLSDNNILCAFKDYKGDLWFGTNKGLNLLNADSLTFSSFRAVDGIGNDMVTGVQEDGEHNLWISSNNGLSRFNPQTGDSRIFTEAHGLQDVEFKRGAAFKDSHGFLYFGGINGFNRFHPDSISFNSLPTPIKIVELQVNSRPVEIGKSHSLLRESITTLEQIEIPWYYQVFSLHYAALNYNFSDEIEYSYFLENFDSDWHEVGESRIATYTNMNPGEYLFKVKCKVDGKWEEEQTLLNIIIPPPFWKQLWFQIMIGLLLIMAIIGSYYWRVQRIRLQNKKLSALVDERTSQLAKKNDDLRSQKLTLSIVNKELKERQQQIEYQTRQLMEQRSKLEQTNATKDKFFSIIAHDLRNPFNTILGFSELLLLNIEDYSIDDLREQIEVISQTAEQTYSLFEDLLLWANSQTEYLSADVKEINICTLCEEVVRMMKNQGQRKGINLYFQKQGEIIVKADYFMLKTVVRNLISNAIKFTEAGGRIVVEIDKADDKAVVTISDEGVGIDKEDQQKLWASFGNFSRSGTDNEKGSGLGLLLCKEFVEEQGGTIWVESEPGKGSDFKFSVPLAH